MPAAALLSITGVVSASPVTATLNAPSLNDNLNLGMSKSYPIETAGRPPVAGTDMAPFVLPLQGMTKARFLALRVMSGSLKVKVSTPNGGADQVLPASDLFVIHNPNSGDELTAIKLIGTADIEYILAGEP